MNQRSHYMSATALSGFERNCYIANEIELNIDAPLGDAQIIKDVVIASLHSAIVLGEQDPLLQCVSRWLGTDFDWRAQSKHSAPASIDITLACRTNPERKIGLAFIGLALDGGLDSLPAFPEAMNDVVDLYAHTILVNLCLAEVRLNQDDERRLKPGSCILLPETFTQAYRISMLDAHSLHPLADAVLDIRSQTVSHSDAINSANARKPQSNTPITRIVLRESIEIDIQAWGSGSTYRLGSLVGQSVLVEHKGTQCYNATLCQVGMGLAAMIVEA